MASWKPCLVLLALALGVNTSCANSLADSVFAAIDERDDGLKTINREVSCFWPRTKWDGRV